VNVISNIITKFFNVILFPFGEHHSLALIVLSLVLGVAMAYMFKITSNQKKIKQSKDRFKARVLEMRVYQDDLVAIFKALFGAFISNFYYLRHSLKPILFLIVPVVIVVIQADARFSRVHLKPGDVTILELSLRDGVNPLEMDVSLAGGSGYQLDARPVRVADPPEVNWRLHVASAGMHDLAVAVGSERFALPLVAQARHGCIAHTREASSFWEPLIHPGASIPSDSPIAGFRLQYASSSHPLLFWHTHWLVVLLFYSLLGALIAKFVFKVEI
jgi:hypothetical protein